MRTVKRLERAVECPLKAQIKVEGKVHNLGRFVNDEDAARTYDAAALRFFGEFALTNEALGLR